MMDGVVILKQTSIPAKHVHSVYCERMATKEDDFSSVPCDDPKGEKSGGRDTSLGNFEFGS